MFGMKILIKSPEHVLKLRVALAVNVVLLYQ